jgi:hypothetical protein
MKAGGSHTNDVKLGYYTCTMPTQLKPTPHKQEIFLILSLDTYHFRKGYGLKREIFFSPKLR